MEASNKTSKRFNQFRPARRKACKIPRVNPELDMNQASGKQYIQGKFIKDCFKYTTGEVQPYEEAIQNETLDQEDISVEGANEVPAAKSKRKRLELPVLNNCRGLYENSVLARRAKIVRPNTWSPEDSARVKEDIQVLAKIGPNSEQSFKIVQPLQTELDSADPKTDTAQTIDGTGERAVTEMQDPPDCRQMLTSIIEELDAPNEETNYDPLQQTSIEDPVRLINRGQPECGEKSPNVFLLDGISKSNEPQGRQIIGENDDSPLLDTTKRRSERNCIGDDDDGRISEDKDIGTNPVPGTSGIDGQKSPALRLIEEPLHNAELNSDDEVALFVERMIKSKACRQRWSQNCNNSSQRNERNVSQQPVTLEDLNIYSFTTNRSAADELRDQIRLEAASKKLFSCDEVEIHNVSRSTIPFFNFRGSGTFETRKEPSQKQCQNEGAQKESDCRTAASSRKPKTRQLSSLRGRVRNDKLWEDQRVSKSFFYSGSSRNKQSLGELDHPFTRAGDRPSAIENDVLFMNKPAPPMPRSFFHTPRESQGIPLESAQIVQRTYPGELNYFGEAQEQSETAVGAHALPSTDSFAAAGNAGDLRNNLVVPESLDILQQLNNRVVFSNGQPAQEHQDGRILLDNSRESRDQAVGAVDQTQDPTIRDPAAIHTHCESHLFFASPHKVQGARGGCLGHSKEDNLKSHGNSASEQLRKHQDGRAMDAPVETCVRPLDGLLDVPPSRNLAESHSYRPLVAYTGDVRTDCRTFETPGRGTYRLSATSGARRMHTNIAQVCSRDCHYIPWIDLGQFTNSSKARDAHGEENLSPTDIAIKKRSMLEADIVYSKRQIPERWDSRFFNQVGRGGDLADALQSTSEGLLGSRWIDRGAPRIKGYKDIYKCRHRKQDFKPGRRSSTDPFKTFQALTSEFRGYERSNRPESAPSNAMSTRQSPFSVEDLTARNVYRRSDRPPSPSNY